MNKLRTLLVGMVAVVALGTMASGAGAATIGVTPGGFVQAHGFRTLTLSPGRLNIACDLTLSANLTGGPIVAPLGVLSPWGFMSLASTGGCTGGATLTLLAPSGWVVFGSVSSTGAGIPARIEILFAAFEVAIGSLRCLYQGSVYADLNAAGNQLTFNPSNTIPFLSGGILCPRPGALSGTLSVWPRQTVGAI